MDGILPVYKEAGMTSHDVVAKLRKILSTKKIGHTGTLDPEVEGVLVCCIGKGTKLVEFLMESDKVYRGEITLGWSTDTEDGEGARLEERPVQSPLGNQDIDQAMARMVGTLTQQVPLYSAVKVQGKRLYEYARQGQLVDRPSRQVLVKDFYREGEARYQAQSQSQSWTFVVRCSKGTYVRTLAVDLGARLGYPAHMSKLVRLETAGFGLDQAASLADIQRHVDQDSLDQVLQPLETIDKILPRLNIDSHHYQRVQYGQVLDQDFFQSQIQGPTALYYQDQLIGIYQPHPRQPDKLKPVKMLVGGKGE